MEAVVCYKLFPWIFWGRQEAILGLSLKVRGWKWGSLEWTGKMHPLVLSHFHCFSYRFVKN